MNITYDKSIFAVQLRELLSQKGMMQKELADLMGTTEATISRYVAGIRTPPIETAVSIASVLNVDMETLCGIEPPAKDRQPPDVKILISCYEKASDADRRVIWSLLDRYMSAEQKVIISAMQSEGKTEAV